MRWRWDGRGILRDPSSSTVFSDTRQRQSFVRLGTLTTKRECCLGAAGGRMGEGVKASLRVGVTGRDWGRELGGVGSVVGRTRSGSRLWRMLFSQL